MSIEDDVRAAIRDWTDTQQQLWNAWSELLRQSTGAVSPRAGEDASPDEEPLLATAPGVPNALAARLAGGAEALGALAELSLESWRAAFAPADGAGDWLERMNGYALRWMEHGFGLAHDALAGEIDDDEQWRRYLAQLQGLGLPFLGALAPSQSLGRATNGSGSTWQGVVRDGWDVLPRLLGGLAQAPSLGTADSALQRKVLEGFNAWSACQVLGHEYQTLRARAWTDVVQRAARELAERAGRGEPVGTLREWLMLWIGAGDEVLMQMYRAEDYLRVQRELLTQTLTYRQRVQEVRDLVLRANNLPTRAELDDAYRVIHELRREVRALKKAVAGGATGGGAQGSGKGRTTRPRTKSAPRKRKAPPSGAEGRRRS